MVNSVKISLEFRCERVVWRVLQEIYVFFSFFRRPEPKKRICARAREEPLVTCEYHARVEKCRKRGNGCKILKIVKNVCEKCKKREKKGEKIKTCIINSDDLIFTPTFKIHYT